MRFLFKNLSSLLISLTLAILVWIAAVREQNPPREDDYEQSIPIEVIAPADNLVNTTALPETVRLRLVAPESSWETLTPSKFRASIDLSGLEEGLNDVPIQVNVSDRQIEIIGQSPSEATVNLEIVQAITLPVQIEVLDTPPLGYINRAPMVEPAIVQISGPASLVSQADEAVSEVFIRNSKETLQGLRDVIIRNRANQPVKGLTIDPAKVDVILPIEQRFGYKDVSVRVRVQGGVAPGYRVSNISVIPPTLTLVGNPNALSEIAGLIETTPINLDQATENIIRNVSLNLPDGVTTVLSEQGGDGPGGVQVTVEVTPLEDSITMQRPITQQGIDPNFWWRTSPNRADVFLSGPAPQLQALRVSDIEVIVDLFGLEPGVHKLQPTVFLPEGLQIDSIQPEMIEITIGRIIQRPVTQLELNPSYSWTASPNRVNVNVFGPSDSLEALRSNEVRVIVDLDGLGPGLYEVRPAVSLPFGLNVDSISPETIDVTIELKTSPTITATETVSVTLAPPAMETTTP